MPLVFVKYMQIEIKQYKTFAINLQINLENTLKIFLFQEKIK